MKSLKLILQCDFNIKKKKKNKIIFLIKNTVKKFKKKTKVLIKLVNKNEILKFNLIFRGINKYTNILTFNFKDIINNKNYIGDLIICHELITFKKNKKKIFFLNIIIHGLLHLLNLNHIKNNEKKQMEILEIEILKNLGFDNPYYIIN
ncbi:rRNA maturation RNase YbeY [Enterobacterales bacterium endosymbiont of Anomoneura mori]